MSVAGVVLAAGPSRRFAESVPDDDAPRLKQLLEFGGDALVRRTALTALGSRLGAVLVVVGYEAEAVRREISDLDVAIVDNPRWGDGQSTSVRAGLAALDPAADAALFIPCDQPFLDSATIDLLIAARETRRAPIVRPAAEGRPSAPVLFGRELFDELAAIEGDEGGRQLFADHPSEIETIAVDDPTLLADVDTWDEYLGILADLV